MSDSDSWRLAEGDLITPELTVLRRLGGGFAYEVFLAFDEVTYVPVVVKVVRPDQVTDESTLRGLRREVEALALVNHPVVARGLRFDLDAERPHVVLQHIEGPRLSTLIRRHGPLQPEQLIPLALQLCSALHYLSAEDVVHLDLKPANTIMSGPPRLIDLSVAETLERAHMLEHPVGTDTYMAPEQCEPGRRGQVGSAADIWGLGATLYRAATGKRAFPAGDPTSADPATRWPQLTTAVDPDPLPVLLAEPVLACLEPDPGQRPNAAELSEAFEPVLEAQAKPRLSGLKPRWR